MLIRMRCLKSPKYMVVKSVMRISMTDKHLVGLQDTTSKRAKSLDIPLLCKGS